MNDPSSSAHLSNPSKGCFEPWLKPIKLHGGNRLTICRRASRDLNIQNGDNLAIFISSNTQKQTLITLIKTEDIIGKNLLAQSDGAAAIHEWKHNKKFYHSIIFPKRLFPNGGLHLNEPLFFCVTKSPDPDVRKIILLKKSTGTVDESILEKLRMTLP